MNVGVLCFRFIDDEMPFQKTTRRESLDFIQEHITVADKHRQHMQCIVAY